MHAFQDYDNMLSVYYFPSVLDILGYINTMSHRKQQPQQQVFYYHDFHINKSQSLGNGSFGAVYKAKCDQLPCAAKILHQTILDPADPGASKIMQRFKQECSFLQSVRHPHIVQYLGMTVDPESRLPVLLMELLDENLTKMLHRTQESLAYYVQVDICHDIALAVAYLHSNDIIHRDLSSNNVLMIARRRAKVTDFGMSKLVDSAPSMTPLTTCPGTPAYMPPEALREPPRYTKKLDCFSEGVIMIQVCTRLWPDPGPRTQVVQDLRSPTGMIEMPVLEPERRKQHIDLIQPLSHPLVPIAVECLSYQEKDRPSSEELCQRLADLKESSAYQESAQSVDKVQGSFEALTVKLKEQIRDLQIREADYVQQIQEQHHEIQAKDMLLQQLLDQKESQFQHEISSQQKHIQQLSHKLEKQEKATAKTEQTNRSLLKQVEQLQDRLRQQAQQSEVPPRPPPRVRDPDQIMEGSFEEEHVYTSLIISPPPPPVKAPPHPKPRPKPPVKQKIVLEWRDGGRAPFVMERGDAVVSGNIVYFISIRSEACYYDMVTKTWSKLPDCPYCYSSLVVLHGFVTAIGGCTSDTLAPENKLLCLMREKEWVKYFPPMPTKRWKSSAVTTKQHLVVAGGKMESLSQLNIVEVMDVQSLTWSTVASLPHPFSEASATICGDQLYMLGGFDNNGKTKSVLTCSLKDLLQSSRMSLVWNRVADVPTTRSTCAAVNGHLLAVGGLDAQSRKTSAVYLYTSSTNSWELISNMPTAQYDRLVAVLPNNEMIVVGGCTTFKVNKVDIANVK